MADGCCGHLGCEKDELSDEKKVRAPELSERVQQFEALEASVPAKPIVVLSDSFEVRKKQIPACLQKVLSLRWPGFAGDVQEVQSVPVCPEEDVVADEGQHCSDEESGASEGEEIIDEDMD